MRSVPPCCVSASVCSFAASLVDQFCCIATPAGRVLWYSPKWQMANVSAGLALSEADQLRWQEFVATPEDLAAVMDWLADGRDGPISFQCVMPGTGALVWLHEHKLRAECSGCAFAGSALCPRANGNWLILAEIGDAVITPDRV